MNSVRKAYLSPSLTSFGTPSEILATTDNNDFEHV